MLATPLLARVQGAAWLTDSLLGIRFLTRLPTHMVKCKVKVNENAVKKYMVPQKKIINYQTFHTILHISNHNIFQMFIQPVIYQYNYP